MRAVDLVLVALLALSCSQANPGSANLPSPTPAGSALSSHAPARTPSSSTIEQDLGRCPSAAEVASVDASVSMTFTSDPSAGRLVCTTAEGSRDLTLLQERAHQAVLMFTWIPFDAPAPRTKLPLDAWFARAIHGIDFRGDTQNSYCCEAGGVIVIQTTNLAVLTVGSARSWASIRSLAALFVHEARHNEGYGHTCGDRDNTVAELGAWGVQYYFQLWLGTHSIPSVGSENFRLAARQDAQILQDIEFCSPSPSPTT